MGTYDAPIPGVSGYGQAALLAKTAYQRALTRLNQQRTSSLQRYGYEGEIDPNTGMLGNMHVAANNPYGQYQQMLRGAAIGGNRAHDAALARGLSGGLEHRVETQNHDAFGQQSSQLGQSLQDELSGYQDAQDQAADTRDQSVYEAQHQAVLDALQSNNFDPAHYDTPPNKAHGAKYPDLYLPSPFKGGGKHHAVKRALHKARGRRR